MTSHFSRYDLGTIFSILQNNQNEITREDLDHFVQEAEEVNVPITQSLKTTSPEVGLSPRNRAKSILASQFSNGIEYSPVHQEEYDRELTMLYDTVKTVIHKIDEMQQMKQSKDTKVLLNILFKLNEDIIHGVSLALISLTSCEMWSICSARRPAIWRQTSG